MDAAGVRRARAQAGSSRYRAVGRALHMRFTLSAPLESTCLIPRARLPRGHPLPIVSRSGSVSRRLARPSVWRPVGPVSAAKEDPRTDLASFLSRKGFPSINRRLL